MKKKLELAFSLYSPHLLWELALVVQIVAYMACSVMLISNFFQQQALYRSFQRVFSEECVYFQPYDRLVDIFTDPEISAEIRSELSDNILQSAEQIIPSGDIGNVVNTIGETEDQSVKIVGYNRILAEHMGIYHYWAQSPVDFETEVPVLIRGALCKRYETGDRFSVYAEEFSAPVTAVVIGTLDMNYPLILPSYGASDPGIDGFFSEDIIADDPMENANAVVFCYAGDEAWLGNLRNPACFIFANQNGISKAYIDRQNGEVGGKFFIMKEMIENTIEENVYYNRKPISKVIAASIFTMVSLFGYVFLLFIRNQKLLGVYTLLGMSRKCMYAAIALALGICVGAAGILYVLFNCIALRVDMFIATDASLSVMVYAFALVFTSLLAGALVCCAFIARWQPIHYLKGD